MTPDTIARINIRRQCLVLQPGQHVQYSGKYVRALFPGNLFRGSSFEQFKENIVGSNTPEVIVREDEFKDIVLVKRTEEI